MKRRIKHHQALVWEYLGSIGGSADPGLSENNLRQNPGLYLPGMNIAILWGYPPLKKKHFLRTQYQAAKIARVRFWLPGCHALFNLGIQILCHKRL